MDCLGKGEVLSTTDFYKLSHLWAKRNVYSIFSVSHCFVSVCFAVWKNHHMRTVTNCFIVNLSFADILVTVICLPASLVVDITETWFFGNTLCKVVPYLQVMALQKTTLKPLF